jgi:predicted nucleotidyltransferase
VTEHLELLRVLHRHGVEYVVVGGLAAILQGAPITTLDVDVVYSRSEANVERLEAALTDLDARVRADSRGLRIDRSHLRSAGHKLLRTRLGVLDLLGTVEEATGYQELTKDAELFLVDGVPIYVVSLPRLIAIKEKLTRPKDQLMLMILRATLEERKKGPA